MFEWLCVLSVPRIETQYLEHSLWQSQQNVLSPHLREWQSLPCLPIKPVVWREGHQSALRRRLDVRADLQHLY